MTTPTQLCTRCGEHPRLGALSRCKLCLQADAAAERQHRHRHHQRLDKRLERKAAKDWQAPLDWPKTS